MEHKMIGTITLNPAVDKTYLAAPIRVGEVNRTREVISIPGGKGVNVAKIIQQHDMSVMAGGFLGGYAGQFIEDELEKMGIACCFTRIQQETRSNMNILADDKLVTEILEPGPTVNAEEIDNFMMQYQEMMESCELLILSGSLAKGVDSDFYAYLIQRAREKGVKCFLDTSGEALRKGLESVPFLCKPNLVELEYLVGHPLPTELEILEAAKGLQKKGIENVLVSMGSRGLLGLFGKEIYQAVAPVENPVNTVGCGDSVMASFAMSYLRGDSNWEAMRKAVAVASANASSLQSGVIDLEIVKAYEETAIITDLMHL